MNNYSDLDLILPLTQVKKMLTSCYLWEKEYQKVVTDKWGYFPFSVAFLRRRNVGIIWLKLRWPEGFLCPICSGEGDFLQARKLFECRKCHRQTSATAGTIFHRSRIPLRKWFWAIFLIATSKKGASALYLQNQLEIKTYRAAWSMVQKIRRAMMQRDSLYKLEGAVEADEIFIGGKQPMDELIKQGSNKTPFLIMLNETDQRKPKFLRFEEVESIYEEHILPALEKNVEKGSVLKSDGASVYAQAETKGYENERVVAMREPEKAHEHLKWVNIVTSNLKRFLLSTHHGTHPQYRKYYLAEFAYRF